MLKKTCSFKSAKGVRCKNREYESHLCKMHFKGTADSVKIVTTQSIYVEGMLKSEQDLYEDITVGNLKHEIKLAKLQLRRLFTRQFEYDRLPVDIKNMKVGNITLKDVMVRNGQIVTTSGVPIDLLAESVSKVLEGDNDGHQLIPASSVDSSMVLARPDFEGDIERVLNIIMKLEKVHYELMGGTSDDPNHLAKQVMDALNAIEDNAQGKDYGVN